MPIRSSIFIVTFEYISHLVLVFLLLTLSRKMPAGVGKPGIFFFSVGFDYVQSV